MRLCMFARSVFSGPLVAYIAYAEESDGILQGYRCSEEQDQDVRPEESDAATRPAQDYNFGRGR